MVVEESHRSYERNDSTKATPWPQAFDVKTDLFYPGKAAEFQRQLISALRTRKLLDVLEERPVRMVDLHAANPSASASDVGREGARVGTHFEGPADRVGTII